MKRTGIYYFAFILLILVSIPTYAQNKERIINFHSDIQIDTDGKITVSEHIKVYGGESNIRRGIVRSIPLYRTDTYGKRVNMDFNILHVYKDGEEEPYKTETVNNLRDIYIGNTYVQLKPGIYEYKIVYESYGHIGFFDGYDELYWNATGNDWAFEIEQASATIILPDSTSVINTSCYTGSTGSTATACSSERDGSRITFRSNSSLSPKEGLTVAASFTPGIIKRPPPPTLLERLWLQYGKYGLPAVILLLMLFYYCFTWNKVGRDPEKPTVVPGFNPPHNWSPAVVRYLYKQKYDNKIFTASLVNMAVNKAIRIVVKNKKYRLISTGDNKMEIEEKQIYRKIYSTPGDPVENVSVTVSDSQHTKFSAAVEALKSSLSNQWSMNKVRRNNTKYTVFGVMLAILFSLLYVYLISKSSIFYLIIFLPLFILDISLFNAIMKNKKFTRYIILVIFGIPAMAATAVGFYFLGMVLYESDKESAVITTVFFMSLLCSLLLYSFLIKAPTKEGAQIKADLEGFKMYLKTAEENRLEHLTPPERTPELFERYLPYAIALDVENAWAKKFDNVLKAANYQPDWYVDNKPFASVAVTSALSNSFSSSIRSAQVDPTASSSSSGGSSGSSSWSSGSSGGGFSGGGGGGGGGRGW